MTAEFSGEMLTPVSVGEVIDKITILRIKSARIREISKLVNIKNELDALNNIFESAFPKLPVEVEIKIKELQNINEELWVIEDEIRECEARRDFSDRFIQLARSVYITNDKRAFVKKALNIALGSKYVEEKSYAGS